MNSLQQDVVIPIKICKKKSGSHTYFMHPKDFYVITPLSKLLAKAYSIDKRLKQNPALTFHKFCKLNNITPQYLSGILQINNLSPKLKRMIMDGYQPKYLSIREIIAGSVPTLWEEQEGVVYKMTILPHTHHNSYIFRNGPLNSTKTHLLYKKNLQKHRFTLPHDWCTTQQSF